jgi:serine phosphatase RsbU (regulator of sigma subunit)
LLVGLLVTAALALTSLALYNGNEDRLLKLRQRQLNLVIAATLPAVQTPLASAATLADATGGSAHSFRAFMTPDVGPGKQFVSASLWRLGAPGPTEIAFVGSPPQISSQPRELRRLFARLKQPGLLDLTGILHATRPSLGFAFSTSRRAPVFIGYAESALPANRRSKLESNSAFSDLYYVLYLGRSRSASQLLVTNASKLPLPGRKAVGVVPFGAGSFTLVVAPKGSLGGAFFRDLPWIVGLVGALISLAAALTARRLARGRQRAEQLARDLDEIASGDRARYHEQRSISQTLQHALLPDKLPELSGLQVSALYVPASAGLEVGGDWYDVVELDDTRLLLIIGDVSGHGLEAATTMALLRHAALAYAAEDARPAGILEKLALFARSREGESCFATVLCAQIGLEDRQMRFASAGHLAPLLLDGENAQFVDLTADPAIGLRRVRPQYREAVESLPNSATLIAFTDGLVERRGEVIDAGLNRLRHLATSTHEPLAQLVATLAHELTAGDRRDDTAIVGVRWQTKIMSGGWQN